MAGAVAGANIHGSGRLPLVQVRKRGDRERKREKGDQEKGTPEGEREKLIRFYQARGLKRQEAEAIAHRVALEMESKAAYTICEEIGLTSEESWPTIKAAMLTGLSFADEWLIAKSLIILPPLAGGS